MSDQPSAARRCEAAALVPVGAAAGALAADRVSPTDLNSLAYLFVATSPGLFVGSGAALFAKVWRAGWVPVVSVVAPAPVGLVLFLADAPGEALVGFAVLWVPLSGAAVGSLRPRTTGSVLRRRGR